MRTLFLRAKKKVTFGKKRAKSKITYFDIIKRKEIPCDDINSCLKKRKNCFWLDISNTQKSTVEKIGKFYELHPLIREDVLSVDHRPKIEYFNGYAIIIIKMFSYDEKKGTVCTEQASFVLGKDMLLSFQEAQGSMFDGIKRRLLQGSLQPQADYVLYSLMDKIIDNYFIVLEKLGEKVEELEDNLLKNPESHTLQDIQRFRREMIYVRKLIWPVREIISGLQHAEPSLVHKQTHIYLRDLYDHTIQIIETIEMLREMLSGMIEIYLSTLSNRMNEVMKFLTVIGTIFIPLTFITGLYGMNFDIMPELRWKYGYVIILGGMGALAIGMLLFFRRKKWL